MVSLKLCKEETCKQTQENFIKDDFFEIANDTELMKNKNVKYVKKLCKFYQQKLTKLCEYDKIYCDNCLKFRKHHYQQNKKTGGKNMMKWEPKNPQKDDEDELKEELIPVVEEEEELDCGLGL